MSESLSALRPLSYKDPETPRRFSDSIRETGFGVLTDHPFPAQLFEDIYAEWLAFFDGKAKFDYVPSDGSQIGYFSPEAAETAKGETVRDIKEYFHLYKHSGFPKELSDLTAQYYDQASEFAEALLSWLDAELPADVKSKLSMPLMDMIVDTDKTLLRVLRYPPLRGDEPPGAMRAAAHEDINLITILPAASEAGLQVIGADGEWIAVPGDFGALIVNVGDMLQEATGGFYRSTTHRVVNPTGEAAKRSRISMPLFLHPRREVVLSERHTADSYLQERLRELRART